MAGASARRPIPALIFLLSLSLLSGMVWWRVLHRVDSTANPSTRPPASCATPATRAVALPKPATITVNVLNATNTTGLAKAVTEKLRTRGFKVGVPTNDTTTSTESQVRYATKAVAAARLVQLYVPGSKLVPVTGVSATIVLAIGSSFKVLATPAQIAKAQATATSVKTC